MERSGCPSDARGSYARLTVAGLGEIQAAAPRHVASVRRHLIDALDRTELIQLRAIADRVIEHLQTTGESSADGVVLPICPGETAAPGTQPART